MLNSSNSMRPPYRWSPQRVVAQIESVRCGTMPAPIPIGCSQRSIEKNKSKIRWRRRGKYVYIVHHYMCTYDSLKDTASGPATDLGVGLSRRNMFVGNGLCSEMWRSDWGRRPACSMKVKNYRLPLWFV